MSTFTPLAQAIKPDEKLVTVVVPHDYNLNLGDGRIVVVLAGTQEVPEVVADHPYSKANGVTRYAVSKPEPDADEPAKRGPGRPKKDA